MGPAGGTHHHYHGRIPSRDPRKSVQATCHLCLFNLHCFAAAPPTSVVPPRQVFSDDEEPAGLARNRMGDDDGQFRNEEEAAVDGALARRTLLAHRVADSEGEIKCIKPDGCWLHGAVTRVTSQVRVTDHTVDPTPSTQEVLATTPALPRATDGESATRMTPSQRTRIVLLRMLLLVTVAAVAIVLASYAWHASLEQHRALAEPPPQATRSKFRLLP